MAGCIAGLCGKWSVRGFVVCVTVWRYFPVRPKAQRVLALDASLAQPAVSAQRSIGGKRMLTGDDLAPGMTFHAHAKPSFHKALGWTLLRRVEHQICWPGEYF